MSIKFIYPKILSRSKGILLLMERDAELVKLYNGELKPKEKRIRKKIAKEAFNNYMKLYFDPGHKVTVS